MLRSAPIRLYSALLALAAMLLLASIPTVGRMLSTTVVRYATADAVRSASDRAPVEHAHHGARASEAGDAPALPNSAEDCMYCVLLGSLAQPAAQGADLAVPRAPRAPVGGVRDAPAYTQPLSNLGSRGPPGDAA